MRTIVKVRQVGDTLVVTLPQEILAEVPIHKGDRLMLTVWKASLRMGSRIIITKED